MALDHVSYQTLTGKYTYMSNPAPVIDHPVIPLMGNLFWVLSFRAEADGTRAGDWYLVNCQGVRPVCACRAYTPAAGCKHCDEVARQEPALIAQVDTLLAADRAARKAARQEGRAAA